MFSWIEKMRSRPTHERRRISVVLSACLTLLIFAVWLSAALTTGMYTNGSGSVAVVATPIKTVGKTVSNSIGSVKSRFGELVDLIRNPASAEVE